MWAWNATADAGAVMGGARMHACWHRLCLRYWRQKRHWYVSFLKEHFGPIFKKKEEWGLAVLLLHEQAKGNQSRWSDFACSYLWTSVECNHLILDRDACRCESVCLPAQTNPRKRVTPAQASLHPGATHVHANQAGAMLAAKN